MRSVLLSRDLFVKLSKIARRLRSKTVDALACHDPIKETALHAERMRQRQRLTSVTLEICKLAAGSKAASRPNFMLSPGVANFLFALRFLYYCCCFSD